jgi:predicted naringenin-chalcone synthase
MTAHLLGIGTACPPQRIEQQDAVQMAIDCCATTDRHVRLLPALYRRTHVQTRAAIALAHGSDNGNGNGNDHAHDVAHDNATHIANEAQHAFYPQRTDTADRGPTTGERMVRYARQAVPLGAAAARQAMGQANVKPDQFTHLVSASCTGFSAPGLDIRLIRELGLPPSVQRTHVGFMGCHGAFNAMQVARAIARAHDDAKVLVCSVELCSLHFSYGFDAQRVVANALFADGAGAAVVSSQPGDDAQPLSIAATATRLLDDCEDAMTWIIGDHGFEMTLSPAVPGIIQDQLRPWLEAWLDDHDLAIRDVKGWAIHPGGPRVIESVEQALGLPDQTATQSRQVLHTLGNMSSATILFIIQRLLAERGNDARPIVALGFGPGLVAEAMLIR